MKIKELHVENFKRIKSVDLVMGDLLVVGGNNGQGKSSLLDSIEAACKGKSIPVKPVRHGEEKALIELVIQDENGPQYRVKREIKPDGKATLTIQSEGARYSSPQTLMDGWLSSIALDPSEFLLAAPAKRVEQLKQVTGLDFAEIESKIKAVYDERTHISRIKKEASARCDKKPEDLPVELLDLKDLAFKAAEFRGIDAKIAREKEKQAECNKAIEEAKALIVSLSLQIEQSQSAVHLLQIEQKELDGVEEQLATASATNASIQENNKRRENFLLYQELVAKEDALTQELESLRKEKEDKIANAKMPISNLFIGQDDVEYKGIPFSQLSQAEALKVAVAVAVFTKPQLKTILVRNGAFMDNNSMETLSKLAAHYDYQLLIERVGDDPLATIIIEEGEIKAA